MHDAVLPDGPRGRGLDPAAVLEHVLAPDSMDLVLERAAAALGEACGAAWCAVVALDGEHPTDEAYWPGAPGGDADRRAAARRAARALAAGGAGDTAGAAREAASGPAHEAWPLVLAGQLVGAALLAGARPGAAREPVAAALRVALGARLAHHRERASARDRLAQYERWFRVLDDQVRALDVERQKAAALVQHAEDAVALLDADGRILSVKPALAAEPPAGGGTRGWAGLGCDVLCRTLGDGAACDTCAVRLAGARGEPVERVLRRVDESGARERTLHAFPLRGPEGRTRQLLAVLRDRTDVHQLRRAEARYRLLFERNPRAIVMVDPASRRVLLANPAACHVTGRTADELARLRLEDLHPRDEWARLQSRYAAGFAGRTLPAFECRLAGRGGGDRLALASGTHVELDGQEAVMLEFQDVTESRRVEEALRDAEERLRVVLANAPLVLFALDADGVFTLSEGRGLAALGLRPGEVVGRTVWDVYAELPQVLDSARRVLAGEEVTALIEVGPLAFETRYSPLRDAVGGVTGAIGVAVDVTDRRRLEAELRQAQKMEAIGRLAGGVAHDFNNLLAAILGHAEIAMGRVEPGHPLRRNLEEIQRAGARGAHLTRQLLTYGRKGAVAPRVLDVNAVVADLQGLIQRLAGEDLEVVVRPAPIPALVRADRGELEQTVMNLAVNARDAMPGVGRLEISIEHATLTPAETGAASDGGVAPGAYVLLSVSDDGCGMDDQTLARAFEPYFTTKATGTGLGLSTVHAVARRNGGHVTVTSAPGLGTTFRVFLPRVEGDEARAAAAGAADTGAAAPEAVAARPGHETVLLVEDDEAVRALARDVLRSRGYTVLEATNGVDALWIARRHEGPLHLAVTDVVMPHMGGGALAEQLAVLRPGLRVLYMSGYPDEHEVRGGPLASGAPFLAKPFSVSEFLRRVRETLDAPLPEGRVAA
uniref:histidine kinase n=1 Tax=Eiseniibacteriota bacterium TaxID=2212470 RepID=A0A832I3J7_UNCEI